MTGGLNSMRLVFATFNAGKLREVASILAGVPVELVSPADVGVRELPEETGDTFLENAILKAAHVFRATGLATVADDSGLEVAALGGEPGVHSARYAGPAQDAQANLDKLLDVLRDVDDRRARFVCTAALVLDPKAWPAAAVGNPPPGVARFDSHPLAPAGTLVLVATGEVRGTLLRERRGEGGFGYDPVFNHEGEGGTFAELADGRKNDLSHRGQAFRKLRAVLSTAGSL